MQINAKQLAVLNKIGQLKRSSTRKLLANKLSQIDVKRRQLRQLLAELSKLDFSKGVCSETDLKLQANKDMLLRKQLREQELAIKTLKASAKTLQIKFLNLEQQQKVLNERSQQLQIQDFELAVLNSAYSENLSVNLEIAAPKTILDEFLNRGAVTLESKNRIETEVVLRAALSHEFGDRIRNYEIYKSVQALQFSFELISQQGNFVRLFLASSEKGKIKLLTVSGDNLHQLSELELQRLTSALKLAGVEKVRFIKN